MDTLIQLLENNPAITTLLITSFGIYLITISALYFIAFFQGREVSFWPPKIGSNQKREETIRSDDTGSIVKSQIRAIPRIALMCSTTFAIERSQEKKDALKLFYGTLIAELDNAHYGINTCGPEPLRQVFFEHYCTKLRSFSKTQMEDVDQAVRWYWFAGDSVGLNYAPAFYESHPTLDSIQRISAEISNSDIIIAFTGRSGTRREIEQVLQLHRQRKVDLERKPLILLGWFGGAAKDYIDEKRDSIEWILQRYSELNPAQEIEGWEKGENPTELARRLVNTIEQFL